MHLPPQVAHFPTFQRPDPNLSRRSARSQWYMAKRQSNTQFQKMLSEKPQFNKHDVARGPILYEQSLLSIANGTFSALAGLGMPLPACAIMPITGPLQLATLAEAAWCIGRRSRIKKGKGKYDLLKSGSYGKVRKHHMDEDAAMRSLLKRTVKGNPTLKPNKGNPFEIHAHAGHYQRRIIKQYKIDATGRRYVTQHYAAHPISRFGIKTIIYTRDPDLANQCYDSALKLCQRYLHYKPNLLSKNPKYRQLLNEPGLNVYG